MLTRFWRISVLVVCALAASMAFAQAQSSASADFEKTGQAAQQEGRFQDAFTAYLSAYQALPDPPSAEDDRRLRERIIRAVQRLDTPPAIPAAAREHASKADQLLDAERILGATAGASSQSAAIELRSALRAAPWWAPPTLKLATVLQKLQRVDEALLNLNLYKLADPVGYLETLERAAPKAPAAPAPSAPPAAARSTAPAMLYVYWPQQQRGSGRKKVACDAQNVAELRKNRYVALKAAPGTHTVTYDGQDVLVAAEPGVEYFFRASLEGHTAFTQGATLRQVTTDIGKAEIKEQHTTINDAKKTFSSDCLAAPVKPRGR